MRTPDHWVKRNPQLIRLTGQHPFNAEASLDALFSAGFLTPAHLHFVRNHGAVPKVDETKLRNWRIRVHGLVKEEYSFSLDDLRTRFQTVTLPVTLVCAGNRRKEQNVIRKSLGFSWGAAGVSTALWTGVYLADVLEYVKPIRPAAKHVIFEGTDNLPNGPYGTSQRLNQATDRRKGMLIAWAMNGLPLEPDHGFPVRVIIPGQIGGRMVKWLNRIEVSEQESQHHLHFWDNKVLPMQLTPERARSEQQWWYDPRYIITELNINSAIVKPAHDETITVNPGESDKDLSSYTVKGYAYSGGGRRVTRVEVSLDDGDTWVLANIDYPEDLYRQAVYESPIYGTLDLTQNDYSFCWCFWTLDVTLVDLMSSNSIAVRAMDESMNIQPRDMYLNATSMMNNWWFRVAIHKTSVASGFLLRFEHPTLVDGRSGGWMERMKSSGVDPLKPRFGPVETKNNDVSPRQTQALAKNPAVSPGVDRRISVAELREHDKSEPWFVVNGEVYDGTTYLKDHPGGADSILLMAGEDATDDFVAIHSMDATAKLADFHIGTLSEPFTPAVNDNSDGSSLTNSSFLDPKRWKTVTLSSVRKINHDSLVFSFSLGNTNQAIGLPIGQHVFVRIKRKDTDEIVQRAYTPVSRPSDTGRIEFLIKLYLPSPQFPAGGRMSVGLEQLKPGDTVEIKGPLGSFIWQGRGKALIHNIEREVKNVGLVCGGTGITPVLQVLRSILEDTEDRTQVWLLYANKTEADILCRDELDHLFKIHGQNRFKLHYTVGTAPKSWTYSIGRVTEELLKAHLPPPCDDSLILACGPEPMINHCVKPGLQKYGWNVESSLFVF
ncbi:unnamed protein product [Somion occarium]|uniref:Nitrate reductase [NADPH] n=1 Tax=Somion occarium TaxID=3059160 RepID=A0ABP1D515_9APHY